MDGDSLGHRCAEGFEFLLDGAGEFHGVRAGLFGDCEHDAGLAVDAGLAAFHKRSALANFGDVAKEDIRAARCGFDHRAAEVGGILDTGQVADEFFLIGLEQKAARRIHIGFIQRGADLVE